MRAILTLVSSLQISYLCSLLLFIKHVTIHNLTVSTHSISISSKLLFFSSFSLLHLSSLLCSFPNLPTPPQPRRVSSTSAPTSTRRWRPAGSRGATLRAPAAAVVALLTTWHPKTWGPALPRCPQDTLHITAAQPPLQAQLLPWPGSCCLMVSHPQPTPPCQWRGRTQPWPAASRCSLHSSWTTWLASRASRWDARMWTCYFKSVCRSEKEGLKCMVTQSESWKQLIKYNKVKIRKIVGKKWENDPSHPLQLHRHSPNTLAKHVCAMWSSWTDTDNPDRSDFISSHWAMVCHRLS